MMTIVRYSRKYLIDMMHAVNMPIYIMYYMYYEILSKNVHVHKLRNYFIFK